MNLNSNLSRILSTGLLSSTSSKLSSTQIEAQGKDKLRRTTVLIPSRTILETSLRFHNTQTTQIGWLEIKKKNYREALITIPDRKMTLSMMEISSVEMQ